MCSALGFVTDSKTSSSPPPRLKRALPGCDLRRRETCKYQRVRAVIPVHRTTSCSVHRSWSESSHVSLTRRLTRLPSRPLPAALSHRRRRSLPSYSREHRQPCLYDSLLTRVSKSSPTTNQPISYCPLGRRQTKICLPPSPPRPPDQSSRSPLLL